MGWLYQHIKHDVIPALKVLEPKLVSKWLTTAANNTSFTLNLGATGTNFPSETTFAPVYRSNISVDEVEHKDYKIRPAKAKSKELGLLIAALKSFNKWDSLSWETQSLVLDGKGTSKRQADMDQLHTFIKNSSRALVRLAKKTGGRIFLPGRDTWPWFVFLQKYNVEVIYDGRISRKFCSNVELLKSVVDEWHLTDDDIIFDTGFAGSIYSAIKRVSKKNPHNLMLSTPLKDFDGRRRQLFPNHKGSRAKALSIEYFPKYYTSGTSDGRQYLNDLDEFVQAASLTIWIHNYESPKWISQGGAKCKGPECVGCRSCQLWKHYIASVKPGLGDT